MGFEPKFWSLCCHIMFKKRSLVLLEQIKCWIAMGNIQVMPAHYWVFWFLIHRQVFINATVVRLFFSLTGLVFFYLWTTPSIFFPHFYSCVILCLFCFAKSKEMSVHLSLGSYGIRAEREADSCHLNLNSEFPFNFLSSSAFWQQFSLYAYCFAPSPFSI